MEKEERKPRVLPQPPKHPGVVEPIIANDMRYPAKGEIVTDPDGSYTGRPLDGGQPVQDADDL